MRISFLLRGLFREKRERERERERGALFFSPFLLDGGKACGGRDHFSFTLLSHAHTNTNRERTYIMIKPDGVQRGLIHKVIERFEQRGFYLKAMKMQMVTKEHAEKHYADLSSKPFFAGLVAYMCSGPVVCMVWEGKDVVKTGRKIIGATNPLASEPGSLRGDFCIEVGRNVIHGSDAVESANHEIALWFPEGVCEYEHALQKWIYE